MTLRFGGITFLPQSRGLTQFEYCQFPGRTNGYAVTQSHTLDPGQVYLTDVGAYSNAISPYGTFDMGGDVWQFGDTVVSFASTLTAVQMGGPWDLVPAIRPPAFPNSAPLAARTTSASGWSRFRSPAASRC